MGCLAKNVPLMHFNDMLYNILLKIVKASNNHLININEAFTNYTLIYSIDTYILPWTLMHWDMVALKYAAIRALPHDIVPSDSISDFFKDNNSWSAAKCYEA